MLQRGMSLLEVLIALTVVAIVMTAAMPLWSNLVQQNQQDASISSLLNLLQFAKQQAIFQGNIITICPLSEKRLCINDWSQKIAVFHDDNNNHELDKSDKLLQSLKVIKAGAKLQWRGFPSKRYLQFYPGQRLSSHNGRFIYQQTHSATTRSIILSRTGRLRVE